MLAIFFITISHCVWRHFISMSVRLGRCRVAAAEAFAGYMLAIFFITISHCVWRHFISMSVRLGRCRVAAAEAFAGYMLAIFFITISHCAWQHFISLSNGDKETKQRKRLPTEGELVSLACRLGAFGT
jgi:hypothetical protein